MFVCSYLQAAIANAKTLEEVERLNNMLKTGQIPGKAQLQKHCKCSFTNVLHPIKELHYKCFDCLELELLISYYLKLVQLPPILLPLPCLLSSFG